MFTIWAELKRLWAYKKVFLAYLAKNFFMLLLLVQFEQNNSDIVWLIIPLLSMSSEVVYRQYLEADFIDLTVRYAKNKWHLLRFMFFMLSVFLNLPLALMLTIVTQKGINVWLTYWFVLDILGILFHSVCCLSNQLTGTVLSFLLMMPLGYPWIMFGMMSIENHMMALKILWSSWVLMLSLGVFFYLLCFRIGNQS